MKNISGHQVMELARRYSQYVLTLIIFAVFIFYNVVVVPPAPSNKFKSSVGSAERIVWDITTEKPEKIFTGVLQGLPGDWYRLGVSTKASRAARLNIELVSIFDGKVSLGSWDLAENDNFQYHEIIFQIPNGKFSDLHLVLQNDDSDKEWSYAGVKLSGLSLSRLNVKNKFEADKLLPTLAGEIQRETKILAFAQPSSAGSNIIFESRFTADADFVENIRLNAKEKSGGQSYVLELKEESDNDADAGKRDASVKKVILESGELGSAQDEWGNQLIAFPARLEKGDKYIIALKVSGSASRNLTLLPLQGLGGVESQGNDLAAIVLGRYKRAGDGALLSGAKVEDFGDEILYSYSLSGEQDDFFNLFDAEGSVKFDAKQKIISGRQQNHTSFTYYFFTVYPFEKFMLLSRQARSKDKEVKLEYSFDNVFWKEVPPAQADNNDPPAFSFTLSGDGSRNAVYVRVSYNGEDKKTGTFGLDQLSVQAKLIRK